VLQLQILGQKILAITRLKKTNNSMTIKLIKNKDILASVCQLNKKPICIGFAAETENFIDNARAKLASKQCEAIILNDVSQSEIGLNSDENEVHFITKENCEKIEKNSKQIIAEKVIQKITNYYF
jgi:phosphopantothenoylcysteine decarboxylase/phosphopantothenate--cysteine ligase